MHTQVVRYDFGGYGYSSATNAVLYNEPELLSRGMLFSNVITGGYRGDIISHEEELERLKKQKDEDAKENESGWKVKRDLWKENKDNQN